MSDDLGKKIRQITDMLGQEGMADNLKDLIGMLATSGSKEETPPKPAEVLPSKEEKPVRTESDENMEMMRKIGKIMDGISPNSDPRINLLYAIRPFLNNTRQKKLNNCVKILQMSRLAGFIDKDSL